MICKKCEADKEVGDFYTPLSTECKECIRNRVRKREARLRLNPEWVEKEKKRAREKYHRLEYKNRHKPTPEKKKEIMDRYKKRYPEKIDAHLFLFNKQIKAKVEGNHLHHWSYNKEHWADTIEMTEANHNLLHRHIQYDQERMMYRDLQGYLLDTKEAHVNHFELIKEKCV